MTIRQTFMRKGNNSNFQKSITALVHSNIPGICIHTSSYPSIYIGMFTLSIHRNRLILPLCGVL